MKDAYPFQLTAEQFAAAVLYRAQTQPPPRPYRIAVTLAVACLFGAVAFLFASASNGRSVPATSVLAALVAMALAFAAWRVAQLQGLRATLRRARHMTKPRTLVVEEAGLRLCWQDGQELVRWEEIEATEIHRDILYVRLDAVAFCPIPVSAFASMDEAESFAQEVTRRVAGVSNASAAATPVQASDLPSAASTRRGRVVAEALRSMAVALLDGFRLVLFRPIAPGRPTDRWAAVLLLAVASLAIPVAAAVVAVGLNGEFNGFSIGSASFHVPVLLAAAIVAASIARAPAQVPRFLAAGLLASIALDIFTQAGAQLLAMAPRSLRVMAQFAWLLPVWLAGAWAVFVARSVEFGLRRAAVMVLCMLLVAVPLGSTYRDRALWHAPYSPQDDESSPAATLGPAGEDVLYKQPALLAQELEAVRPATSGVTNVYFVGMAGYGGQDVFRKEVQSVAQMFRERFGADGHTVRLINSNRTLLDVPIANMTSLRAALRRVGDMMDKERDVLVLYMTSHGSEDHQFSLWLWPMRFHELDPAGLRALLDESGIRNRVVIVSACYSGGFVNALRDPDTLVITASAADRNSFGCSNDAEWTYFGKAYFDESLRNTHSFVKAFDMAKPRIAARERDDRFDASDPQIAVGERIRSRLDALERQLDGLPSRVETQRARTAAAQDPYQEYVNLMFTADYLEDMKKACAATLDMGSPEQQVTRNTGAFGGMERSGRHWKELNAAWGRYAGELCDKGLDRDLIRGIYAEKVRATIGEAELRTAMAFLRTAQGARWIRQDREASRQENLELGRLQSDLSVSLYRKYLDEQGRIFEDFRRGAH